jgi:hypothetical protein
MGNFNRGGLRKSYDAKAKTNQYNELKEALGRMHLKSKTHFKSMILGVMDTIRALIQKVLKKNSITSANILDNTSDYPINRETTTISY